MIAKSVNPITRANRRYFLEFGLAMTAYVAVMLIRHPLLHRMDDSSLSAQIAVAIAPAIPVLFTFIAVVRLIRHTDELMRRTIVESLALAGGITAFLSIAYGLVEPDFLPRPSAWWTWVAFGVAWLVSSFLIPRRYR